MPSTSWACAEAAGDNPLTVKPCATPRYLPCRMRPQGLTNNIIRTNDRKRRTNEENNADRFDRACDGKRASHRTSPTSAPSPATMVAHRVEYLTTVLSLTSAQQQQATTIFTNATIAESGVHDNLRAARQSLQTAIAGNDSAGIDEAAATIGSLQPN